MSPRTADRTLAVLALLLVGSVAAWLGRPAPEAPTHADAAGGLPVAWAQAGATGPSAEADPARTAHPAQTAEAFDHWLQTRSALRGTALDGDWGLDPQGRVRPSLALRRRFDHLLQLQGQAPLPALAAWLEARARRELGAEDAALVMSVWRAYTGLQAAAPSAVPAPDDLPALAQAMDERRALRRQWLGLPWAEAFYGAEEADWARRQARGGAPARAAPLIDRERLSPEAAQRLAEVEAEQARWEARLGQARAELARLREAPELSAPQREAAIARLLEQQFAEGSERLRARALLGLAPG